MLQQFKNIITANKLFQKTDSLLIATSGGLDSAVLCSLCFEAGYRFSIAHCNFQLRGEESDRDEEFVKALAKKYAVKIFIQHFETDTYATSKKLSIQEAARELRYNWFKQLIDNKESNKLDYLLTAHHADDNNETLLMSFFRGTGLNGLTGIPEKNNHIIRPLLGFSKEKLLLYAKQHTIKFVEDSSNKSNKYTRNYFRNELLPAMATVYPQVNENLAKNIQRFKQIELLYNVGVDAIKQKLCRVKGNETHIPVKQLMQYNNKALVYEIIHPFGFAEKQIDEVIKLYKSESGKYVVATSGSHQIIKHRHWLIISPIVAIESANIIIEENDLEIKFAIGKLSIKSINRNIITEGLDVAVIDFKEISFPLLLRKWKAGDYFYPLGMKKKKKIARFLIDQKLSKTEKANIWVIESQQRIVWIVGYRIDDRMKVTATTQHVLQIVLSK